MVNNLKEKVGKCLEQIAVKNANSCWIGGMECVNICK